MNPKSQLINTGWFFKPGHTIAESAFDIQDCEQITLPHNAVDVPLNYFDETKLHQTFSYYYPLTCSEADLSSQWLMKFDGALCDSRVYVNGQLALTHHDGYTPFEVRLTPFLKAGDNLISVLLSGVENPEIPPFGGRIDFLCFPGIYRDVFLTRHDDIRIKNIKIETKNVLIQPEVTVDVRLETFNNSAADGEISLSLIDPCGTTLTTKTIPMTSQQEHVGSTFVLSDGKLWDCDNPQLYSIHCELSSPNATDCYRARFGIREACFNTDGFYLNGQRLQLTGINRHQSYPYIGYAMGKSGQEFDAEVIKYDYGFNLVRTSHYPQSSHFLNRCDEIGLLVFEEIAGWQHVGDEQWQKKSLVNVQGMIERDWNHPSIILWGVRVNESGDYHQFYSQSNKLARELDPSRQTGGVRCIQDSEFLEDVYTMNDFVLGEGNKWVRSPQNVTGLDHEVPYLITEYAGHMYPTKRRDCETWQIEHVMRHLKVLDGSRANPNISGSIAWCLFDYNTHQDFGSGDKICYHGISDAFRMPKFAAYVYASQQSPSQKVVLKPVTYWTRGERPEAKALPIVVLTNCDCIEMSMPTGEVKRFYPDRSLFAHLAHPPVIIDEWNLGDFPIGDWGYAWADLHFKGIINGETVKEVSLAASPIPTTLSVDVHKHSLTSQQGDSTRVAIEVLDQNNNLLPYFGEVLTVSSSTNLTVIGPNLIALEGGVAGFWVKAETAGKGHLIIESQTFGTRTVTIDVTHATDEQLEVHNG